MGIYKDKNLQTEATERRSLAEERLRAKTAKRHPPRTEEEAQRLVHELEVHQVELEMQNEELRQARDEREVVLEKYTDLYDFAPVGYFTLDRNGVILNVNLSGASLFGVDRSRLLGRHYGQFVADEARSFFSEFLGKVFASQGKVSCEVMLKRERERERGREGERERGREGERERGREGERERGGEGERGGERGREGEITRTLSSSKPWPSRRGRNAALRPSIFQYADSWKRNSKFCTLT